MRLPKDILSGRAKKPEFYLCQADKTILGGLNVTNASAVFKFNSYSEINCDVYRDYQHPITGQMVENPFYEKIEALRLLYIVGFGYFQIQESNIVFDGSIEYKSVVAYSLEYSLCNRYLDNFIINLGIDGSIDGVKLLNQSDISHSLIHLILDKMPEWTVGHVDMSIQDKRRSFEVDHQAIYDFMMNDMCDAFGCVFEFNTINNTIDIYDEETYSLDSNIYVSMDTIASSAEISYNADDIKTRLYVYGADDISIREVNLGLDYITNINYYCSPDWLGEELYNAYINYCKLVDSYREQFSELMLDWSEVYDKYSELYNKIPDYDESSDSKYPIVHSKSELPVASSSNVYQIYKVVDGDATCYYKCISEYNNGVTTYKWTIDIDNINSFYTFPTPSIEYVGGVYKVYNSDSTDGVLYYICESYRENGSIAGYRWVLAESDYGINMLKEKEACYLDIQEVQVSAGFAEKTSDQYNRYLENYEKLIEIQATLKKQEEEAARLKSQLDSIMSQMNEISKEIELENNFTPEQIKNLNPFIREDQLKDDHYLVTELDDDKSAMETKQELLKYADKELAKISQPQLSFSMSLANILEIPEFEPVVDSFETGNNIAVEIRPNYVVKTQILEVELNFDDMSDFNVTFGNLSSLYSQTDIHAALLSQAVSAGKSVAESSSYWEKGANTATNISKRIENGLIDALTTIKSTENQAISWDSHGFHLRKYADESKSTYEDDQIWLNNEKIVFTDDNWRTAKMAVGKFNDPEIGECYGIIAPNIVGKMIVGQDLIIETESKNGEPHSFRVDQNGASLYNASFEIQDGNTHIVLDPDLGIGIGTGTITKEDSNGIKTWNQDNCKFWVDDNGNIQIKGNITGEIKGRLNALDLVVGNNSFITQNGVVSDSYLDMSSYATMTWTSEQMKNTITSVNGELTKYATTEWTSGQISSTVSSIEASTNKKLENYSTLKQTSDSIEATVKSINETTDKKLENYSTVKQTSDSISLAVSGLINEQTANSLISQKVDKITLSVTNGESSSTIALLSDGVSLSSQTIKFTGDVVFASDLENGTTTIDGACIKTGTIDADRINMTGAITWDDLSSSVQEEIYNQSTDLPSYITRTHIDGARIESPTIEGNDVIARTAFRITPVGTNSSGDEVDVQCGFMGTAFGEAFDENLDVVTSYGVAVASSDTTVDKYGYITFDSTGHYMIVTNRGVRLQAGDNNITVTDNGAFYNGVEIGSGIVEGEVSIVPVWG